MAYELEYTKFRRHMVLAGQRGHCTPFLVAEDVMLVCARCGGPHNMTTIRKVHERIHKMHPLTIIMDKDKDLVAL